MSIRFYAFTAVVLVFATYVLSKISAITTDQLYYQALEPTSAQTICNNLQWYITAGFGVMAAWTIAVTISKSIRIVFRHFVPLAVVA